MVFRPGLALASRVTILALSSFVLLTALGGTLRHFQTLLFLHSGLLLAVLVLEGRSQGRNPRLRALAELFPLLILPLLFWSHRAVWTPVRFSGLDGLFRFGDRLFRGRAMLEANALIQEGGGWGRAWIYWLLPALGFCVVAFLIWTRASRESFNAFRDGAVVTFYLSCLISLVFPLEGPAPEPDSSGPLVLRALSRVSAWDGAAPASALAGLLWGSWKSCRVQSLFLSKFFLILAVISTLLVAFGPAHYALSAFLSPALGLSGAALAQYFRRRDAEAQKSS